MHRLSSGLVPSIKEANGKLTLTKPCKDTKPADESAKICGILGEL
jgi:hypothetical protein